MLLLRFWQLFASTFLQNLVSCLMSGLFGRAFGHQILEAETGKVSTSEKLFS